MRISLSHRASGGWASSAGATLLWGYIAVCDLKQPPTAERRPSATRAVRTQENSNIAHSQPPVDAAQSITAIPELIGLR